MCNLLLLGGIENLEASKVHHKFENDFIVILNSWFGSFNLLYWGDIHIICLVRFF